ncbi:MAG: PKD domain-containing protein [Methanospirillum sp.]|uniref:PKD domain-containing protein n=1 Tax=Methanospirillum sp. TaxID=45200 RepID=UPI002372E40E|nr:PKD domain-containing protein [Methanospirillum sp.]MDD1729364.1 PKD domain-containing protein [Methanospirillum sp.]
MRNINFFKKRECTAIIRNLYLVLLIGCICVAGCGYATADTLGVSDNPPPVRDQATQTDHTVANSSIFDDSGLMPGIGYQEDLMENGYPHFRSRGREFVHTDTNTKNATGGISTASTPGGSVTGSSGVNTTDIELNWQKCLGGSDIEELMFVTNTTDGGYLVGGFTQSFDGDISGNHGSADYWIIKLDASRNVVWQKCFGGSGYEQIETAVQSADGGYLAVGYTTSNDGNVTGYHGEEDIWAVKLDASGNIAWQKCLGGSYDEEPYSLIQTSDGGYLVGGNTRSNDGDVTGNHGSNDIWVVKLDGSGNITWQRCLGGSSSDISRKITHTSDGGYVVAGSTYSEDGNVTGNHGDRDIWIVKLDGSGNITWQKCLGGSDYEFGYSVIQAPDGGYLVRGITYSNDGNVTGNHGEADIWILNLDTSGDLVWQKCLGGSEFDFSISDILTPSGEYLVNGYTTSTDGDVTGNHGESDIWIVNLDTSGNINWQNCLGGLYYEDPSALIQSVDGGYLASGSTYSNDKYVTGNHGGTDMWAVKLDGSGNITWQRCLGGSGYEYPISVIQTTDGKYLVNGITLSGDGDVAGNHGASDIWMTLLGASHPVNATADSWTVAYPPGTTSYAEGTNATYLALAKPGADLVNVSVDGEQVGQVSNWTFSVIAANHTFATTGQPTPGQVHAYFTQNTTWGAVPLTVQFTNQSLGDPTAFSWSFGDGQSSTEQNPVHTYMTPGTYSVTLRATNAVTGGIATLSNAVTATDGVVPSPTPTPVPGEITAAFSADRTSGVAPVQVSFLDQSTGNPTSWLWNLGDGTISTARNVTHIYATKGTYSVSLIAQNSLSSGSIEKSGYITVT